MSVKVAATLIAIAILGVALVLVGAALRWNAATAAQLARLTAFPPRTAHAFDAADLQGLPPPVARYLRAVLRDGQPLIREARLAQRGTFLLRPPRGWCRFEARHIATVAPAGFIWDARIRMAPAVGVRVRDAFVGGAGFMRASIAGLVTVADAHETPAVAEGALMRYLAEAAWYPTALLPSEGVAWSAIDDSSARATLSVSGTTVSLDFHFDEDSLIAAVYSPARPRDVSGRAVPTPWRGRWLSYEVREGVRIPLAGEVEWILPEGPQPYWRGEITEARFICDEPRAN